MLERLLGHTMKNGTVVATKGLKGEDIPMSARLMALADVYDALIGISSPFSP